ncbi:MAG: alanine/ornithine racemase family PLP-dependent enzyme [Nocardioides sp.]
MSSPRVEIDLDKIEHNTRTLVRLMTRRGIDVTGITKGTVGLPPVAEAMVAGGAIRLGDSRIANLERLRDAGIGVPLMLTRSPTPQECQRAVACAAITLVSEREVIAALSAAARVRNRAHQVVIMVELGDLREGVLPDHVVELAREITRAGHLSLVGMGTNLACRNGVTPSLAQMTTLGELSTTVRRELALPLPLISGGNSANVTWALTEDDRDLPKRHAITDLRLGEAILLGTDPVSGNPLPGLHTDAFTLVASVIESLRKPSKPWGDQGRNTFGPVAEAIDVGPINQTLLSIGRQDVDPDGLTPPAGVDLLGASSDHLVLRTPDRLPPGAEIRFGMDYPALLRAMTSPYLAQDFSRPRVPA